MRAPGASCAVGVGKQSRVCSGNPQVVGLDRDAGEESLDERAAGGPASTIRELHANQQFRRRYRGDHDVVLVAHHLVDRRGRSLGRDQDGGVEDQPFQRRSSGLSAARSSASS